MKVSDRIKLKRYIDSGCVKRIGEQLILDPWTFPTEDDFEGLLEVMKQDYDFNLGEAGIAAVPKK